MSDNKSNQLGVNFSTAQHRLRRNVMYHLVQKLDLAKCYRCGREIKKPDDLSIDHKVDWLNIDPSLFWQFENIAFSHKTCNIKACKSTRIFYGKVCRICGSSNLLPNRRLCKKHFNESQRLRMRERRLLDASKGA
jgi:hypothetical protein